MNRIRLPSCCAAVLLGTAMLSVVACSSGGDASGSFTVRDSAGITIVETAEPAWHEGERWLVSPEPLVDIGVLGGDPAQQFTQVTTALRLPDGGILVGDLQTAEVRRFDQQGFHVWTAGGKGEGPGEFRGIGRVWYVPEDTIVVYDPRDPGKHGREPVGRDLSDPWRYAAGMDRVRSQWCHARRRSGPQRPADL